DRILKSHRAKLVHTPVAITDALMWLVVLLLLGNVLLSLYTLHKVRRNYLMSFAIRSEIERARWCDNLFRQQQALDGLYRDLKFTAALPPTRNWAASPDFLSVLARHALEHLPRVVVECGSGVTTLVLARCMQLNGSGRVVSLDHDARFAEETRRNLDRHGLSDWAEVVYAPLEHHAIGDDAWNWYAKRNLPGDAIDMLVVDGPPAPLGEMIRYPAGPLLFPQLSSAATVFLDDADRAGERKVLEKWLKENRELHLETLDCEKGGVVLKRQHVV
ncbi:MAG TPA: class I SAM-dependent methyltransferase, partial [Alphaproteobacteria bacterium]|nr:class I SAM-dependent methyltransferase [Alphaproteobacteria bacterium]